jgi:hypothetical protein
MNTHDLVAYILGSTTLNNVCYVYVSIVSNLSDNWTYRRGGIEVRLIESAEQVW